MFENRELRRIFGLKGSGKKLQNEELNGLYFSPTIVRVIKSRKMIWVGHVTRMGESRGVYKVLW
jgi:hypothetical protein